MSIPFKAIEICHPGEAGNGNKKYYARVVSNETTSLKELTKKIQLKSAIHLVDMVRVLYAVEEAIADELMMGNIVHLGLLGSFYPSISSEGKDSPKEVTRKSIKKAKINFRPSREMREKLAAATFEKMKS